MPIILTNTKRPLPPRILLYGPGGIGKTTFAASIPGVALMPVEEGSDTLECTKTPSPKTWDEAMEIVESLTADPQGLKALAIDSITMLQDLCYAKVCESNNCKSIEELGYGKGYVVAGEYWRQFLDRLNLLRQKMVVVLIGHAAVARHEDPRLPGYDRLTPRLQANGKGGGIQAMSVEWADAVLCAAYEVHTDQEKNGLKERTRAVGEGNRVLYCQERPAYLAKNRYNLPSEMPFQWEPVVAAIRTAFAVKGGGA